MGRINQTQPTLYRVSGTDEGRPTRHRCPAGYLMLFKVDLPYTGSEGPAGRATLQKYHYRVARTAALSPGASSTALRRRRPPNHRVPAGTPRLLTTHRNLPTLHRPADSSPRHLGATPRGHPSHRPCDPVLEAVWLDGPRRRDSIFRKIHARPPAPAMSDRTTLQQGPDATFDEEQRGLQGSRQKLATLYGLSHGRQRAANRRSHETMSDRPTLQLTAGADGSTSPSAPPFTGVS